MQDPKLIKGYLNDALYFINTLSVAPSEFSSPSGLSTRTLADKEAPESLRPLLLARPGADLSTAASIRNEMRQVRDRLCIEADDWKSTGTTSDDISAVMARFLPRIEELMKLPNQDALKLSYDLVIEVSQNSYGELDAGTESCGYGDRPSDEPADLLLRKHIRKRKADLEELEETSKHVGDYGIEPWYPKPRKVFREFGNRS